MTFEYFVAYFFVLFVATIIPGPNSLLAINHGANHGIKRTVYSGLGNLIGNLLMALVSILGLGAILLASGVVFTIIKWVGVAYLVYIGIRLILEPVPEEQAEETDHKPIVRKGKDRLFLDGFVIAVGNPKGILFFTALFPQFIDISSATVGTFMIVFATLGIVAFGCYMLYAVCGVKLNRLFRLQSFRKKFNKITGSIFIGTGLILAFSKK
jgi:homoserine/homoserine lactone efflux protein